MDLMCLADQLAVPSALRFVSAKQETGSDQVSSEIVGEGKMDGLNMLEP